MRTMKEVALSITITVVTVTLIILFLLRKYNFFSQVKKVFIPDSLQGSKLTVISGLLK